MFAVLQGWLNEINLPGIISGSSSSQPSGLLAWGSGTCGGADSSHSSGLLAVGSGIYGKQCIMAILKHEQIFEDFKVSPIEYPKYIIQLEIMAPHLIPYKSYSPKPGVQYTRRGRGVREA